MIDVSGKEVTDRRAWARGKIVMNNKALDTISSGNLKKGDVINVAKTAGILGAKQTSTLLPLCHPLPISDVGVEITEDDELPGLIVETEVHYQGKTGVEMEALTACSLALLTIYDMAKGIEKGMKITEIRLVKKTGGKSGSWENQNE